jgi:Na+/proline symporter
MRNVIIILVSLLLLSILGILSYEIIQGEMSFYFAYLDARSLFIDFTLNFITGVIIALLHFLLVRSRLKKNHFIQGIVTGIITAIFFYLLGALANGISVYFSIPPLLPMLRIFMLGFIFPFIFSGLAKLFNPKEKQKL